MSEIERSVEVYDQDENYLPVVSAIRKPGGGIAVTVEVEVALATAPRGAVDALAKVRDYCAGILAAFEGDDGHWDDLPRAEEILRDVLTKAGRQ